MIILVPVSFFLIFILPWKVPVRCPAISDSYTFGFSNITSFIGLALTLIALFLLRLSSQSVAAGDRDLPAGLFCAPGPRSRLLAAGTISCIGLSVAVVLSWWLYLPFACFGESTHFLTRLDMMTLGRQPFSDFEYGYGPAMLSMPFFIHKVAQGMLAIDTSYIITLLLHFALGISAFDYIVRCLRVTEACRLSLLIFATLATLNITLGLIYTPLRFTYALWAVFFLHNTIHSLPPWKTWILVCTLAFVGLLISPDTGLVTCMAFAMGLLSFFRAGKKELAVCSTAVFVSMLMVLGISGLNYFKLIFLFGGGASNFPIFPTPYILVIILVSCWILPRIAVAGWTGQGSSAPLCVSLLFALGLFLPGALGRCDPVHVISNGLGILIMAVVVSFNEKSRLLRAAAVLAAMIVFMTNQVSFWNIYTPAIKNAIEVRNVIDASKSRIEKADHIVCARLEREPEHLSFDWSKRVPFTPDLLELLKYDEIATPMPVTEDIDRFLKASGRYMPGYFVPPVIETVTQEIFEEKLGEIGKINFILVPKSSLSYLLPLDTASYGKLESDFMSELFVFPVNLKVVNEPFIPESLIIRKLESSHEIIGGFRDYLILRRKNMD